MQECQVSVVHSSRLIRIFAESSSFSVVLQSLKLCLARASCQPCIHTGACEHSARDAMSHHGSQACEGTARHAIFGHVCPWLSNPHPKGHQCTRQMPIDIQCVTTRHGRYNVAITTNSMIQPCRLPCPVSYLLHARTKTA